MGSVLTNLVGNIYGKNQKYECMDNSDGCFRCVKLGERLRECPIASLKVKGMHVINAGPIL